jgi:hypothetical protein
LLRLDNCSCVALPPAIDAVEKKVNKEKAARLPLISCAPRFCRGLFSTKAPVLGAANGIESVPTENFYHLCIFGLNTLFAN